jgi:hypothetical protein
MQVTDAPAAIVRPSVIVRLTTLGVTRDDVLDRANQRLFFRVGIDFIDVIKLFLDDMPCFGG